MSTIQATARRPRRRGLFGGDAADTTPNVRRPAASRGLHPVVQPIEEDSRWSADRTHALPLPVLAAGIGILAMEALILAFPPLASVLWALSAIVAGAAAVTTGFAFASVELREQRRWLCKWVGSIFICLGLTISGFGHALLGSSADLVSDVCLIGAVPFLFVAGLLRLEGELTVFRRLKLIADVLVLGLTFVVAGTVVRELLDLAPLASDETVVMAMFFACAYVSLAFAWLVSARPALFDAELRPAGLLAWGIVLLAGGATVQALTMAGLIAESATGIPFWLTGMAFVGHSGSLTHRQAALSEQPAEPESSAYFSSRLHVLPSLLAGVLIVTTWTGHGLSGSAPGLGVYFASNFLAALIVFRLLIMVFENRWLLNRLESTTASDEGIRDLGIALNSSLELPRVYYLVCKIGRVVMWADSAFLWRLDSRRRELELVELIGPPRDDYIGRRISLDDPLALGARVVRTSRAEVVPYALEARRSHGLLTTMMGHQCLLAVPLTHPSGPIGALVFAHNRDPEAFRDRDIAKAEVLGVQAVVAMENALLYGTQRARLQEMKALFQIAQAACRSLSARELCEEMLIALREVVNYRSARIYLADPDTGVLRAVANDTRENSGGSDRAPRSVGPSSIAIAAFTKERIQRVVSEGTVESRDQVIDISQIAVPLQVKNRTVGVVEAEAPEPDAFGETERHLLTSLANSTALAIDNLRLMEEARQVETLRQLDRLKDELLATVSHELRTPLGSIKGYATTLMKHETRLSRGERQEFLHIIDEESDRLNDLIGNLLDLSSLQAGVLRITPEPVHIRSIVKSAAARAQARTDQHAIRLEWDRDPEIQADPKRIEQIFTNLLVNAIKYSPNGGEIVVHGRVDEAELLVSVSDHGIGIPANDVKRIFDHFHRVEGELRDRVAGTGLGLAICRRLVEAHHGRIWADSQVGQGSTFFVQLPLQGKEK